jgi:hypothetical protein
VGIQRNRCWRIEGILTANLGHDSAGDITYIAWHAGKVLLADCDTVPGK